MPVQRKVFRVEQMGAFGAPGAVLPASDASNLQQQEILIELGALRKLIEQRDPSAQIAAGMKSNELRELKDETNAIARAISRTKEEIAALQAGAFNGAGPGRAARELDAVVEDAERATQQILDAAEAIDEGANSLSASLKNGQERTLAQDIQDQVIGIFEACNFQDLTGQRITKVLATLKFVDDHITRMMDIWDGIQPFKPNAGGPGVGTAREQRLLDGPRLTGELGHVSQSEIDALFTAK